jgi:NAD(P)-dependent dehydrogenase (short-subunit alcohol dehydrogenase family)
MKSFNESVAAITGAGSGIGQALALNLAAQGAHLAISDINQAGLDATLDLLKDSGVKVTSQILDVSKKEDVAAWAQKVQADHGKVNLIFNNAGVALGATVEGATYEEYEWMMSINFWGVVYGTKEFLPLIKQAGQGCVINISSIFGITAQPSQSAYNAAKFAVRGFTESLRQELDIQGGNVTALCVHPGGIKTNIANSARQSDSLKSLGLDPKKGTEKFNKMLRKPPSEAASDILDAVKKNKRRVLVGNDAKAMDALQRILPTGYQRIFSKAIKMAK